MFLGQPGGGGWQYPDSKAFRICINEGRNCCHMTTIGLEWMLSDVKWVEEWSCSPDWCWTPQMVCVPVTISRTSPSHSSTHHSLWCTSCTKQPQEPSTWQESSLLWVCSSSLHPCHGTGQSRQSLKGVVQYTFNTTYTGYMHGHTQNYFQFRYLVYIYRMAGNFGGEFILADWRFWEESANISSAKI